MKATFLKEIPTRRDMLSSFGGYDGRARIAEGDFADMKNLSSGDFPVMSVRGKRATLGRIDGLQGFLAKEKPVWVANNRLYYNGEEIPDVLLTDGKKTLVAMGAQVIIYPDQISYNTATGICERVYRIPGSDVEINPVWAYLGDYYTIPSNAVEYILNAEGKLVLFQGSHVPTEGSLIYVKKTINGYSKRIYYRYNGTEFIMDHSDTLRIFIEFPQEGILEAAKYTDGLRLFYKCKGEYRGKVTKIDTSTTSDSVWIYLKLDSSVNMDEFYEMNGGEEKITALDFEYPPPPKLDGIFENGNRLWGYRYGENNKGEFVNEIYSTALGDPVTWDKFEGIASDSYAVSVGSDGPFTGAAYYSGSLYFFKESCFHRLIGSKPSTYQLTTLNCEGVERGSEAFLVPLGDALYYKGKGGIYRYDGGIPYLISEVFGDKRYKNAVGGALGAKLYAELEDGQGEKRVFVYDTEKRLWHIEDAVGAESFITAYHNLLYLADGQIGLIDGEVIDGVLTELFGNLEIEKNIKWFGEFGDFGLSDPDAKYVSKLQLRVTVADGARVTVEVMTDSSGSWVTAAVYSAQNKGSVCLPVVTPRCDHFRLRLSGEGEFKLWSMVKEIESTNEVR